MGKLTKEEYQRKFRERTKLMKKKRQLREARLSKNCRDAICVVVGRKPGSEAACAFMVSRKMKVEEKKDESLVSIEQGREL